MDPTVPEPWHPGSNFLPQLGIRSKVRSVEKKVFRIHRIHMVLDIPDPDLLVRSNNPDRDHAPDLDPKK
jgi:hypothetical protein